MEIIYIKTTDGSFGVDAESHKDKPYTVQFPTLVESFALQFTRYVTEDTEVEYKDYNKEPKKVIVSPKDTLKDLQNKLI